MPLAFQLYSPGSPREFRCSAPFVGSVRLRYALRAAPIEDSYAARIAGLRSSCSEGSIAPAVIGRAYPSLRPPLITACASSSLATSLGLFESGLHENDFVSWKP